MDFPLKRELGSKWKQINWKKVFQKEEIANAYFMRSGLIRKDLLPLYAKETTPTTYVITSYQDLATKLNNYYHDQDDDEDENKKKDQVWLMKYVDSSNAYGIQLFHSSNPLPMKEFLQNGVQCDFKTIIAHLHIVLVASVFDIAYHSAIRVIQKYIIPKLDVKKRKFHIRAMILAVGHLDIYLYSNMRGLLATEEFSLMDLNQVYCHITNRGINQNHPAYSEKEQNLSLDQFPNLDISSIQEQIRIICRKLFSRLSQNRRHFFSLPNCYELFGLDFCVDEKNQVWLLEGNPDPSLQMFHEKDQQNLSCNPFHQIPSEFLHIFSIQETQAFQLLAK